MTLSAFRKKMGVSQMWLADKMNLTPVTISRYENGVHTPPDSFYYHLAHIFRFNPEDLDIDEFRLER